MSRENLRQNIGRASCNFQFKGITMELLSNHYINKERSPFFQLGQDTFGLSFLHPFLWAKVYFQPWLPESYFIPESGFQPWIRITIKLLSNYYIHKEKNPSSRLPLLWIRENWWDKASVWFWNDKIDKTPILPYFQVPNGIFSE